MKGGREVINRSQLMHIKQNKQTRGQGREVISAVTIGLTTSVN